MSYTIERLYPEERSVTGLFRLANKTGVSISRGAKELVGKTLSEYQISVVTIALKDIIGSGEYDYFDVKHMAFSKQLYDCIFPGQAAVRKAIQEIEESHSNKLSEIIVAMEPHYRGDGFPPVILKISPRNEANKIRIWCDWAIRDRVVDPRTVFMFSPR